MRRHDLFGQSHIAKGCSCLVEIDILALYPLFICFLYPGQVHYLEVESTVTCKLLLRGSLLQETYYVLWGVDAPYDHVCHIRSQVGFEDGAHLLCMVYEHRLRTQQQESRGVYSLFVINASAAEYY